MAIRKIVLCIFLTFTTIVWAQRQVRIPAEVVDQQGAPAKISGEVVAKDISSDSAPSRTAHSFNADLYLTNESAKPILLMIIDLKVISPFKISLDYTEVEDYFFESTIPQPGSTVELRRNLGTFGEPQGPYEPFTVVPSTRATVVFLQFMDGSTWGDAVAAEKALRDRQRALEQLELLKVDEKKESRKQLLAEIEQPTSLQPISSLQDLYRGKKDLAVVETKVNDMLKNARRRKMPGPAF